MLEDQIPEMQGQLPASLRNMGENKFHKKLWKAVG